MLESLFCSKLMVTFDGESSIFWGEERQLSPTKLKVGSSPLEVSDLSLGATPLQCPPGATFPVG